MCTNSRDEWVGKFVDEKIAVTLRDLADQLEQRKAHLSSVTTTVKYKSCEYVSVVGFDATGNEFEFTCVLDRDGKI